MPCAAPATVAVTVSMMGSPSPAKWTRCWPSLSHIKQWISQMFSIQNSLHSRCIFPRKLNLVAKHKITVMLFWLKQPISPQSWVMFFWGQNSSNVAIVFLTCLHFSLPFPADVCIPISESVLSPHISPLDEHNKHSAKEHSWRKSGKIHAKHPLKSTICSYVIHSKKLYRKLLCWMFLSAFLIIIAWKALWVHSLWVSRVHEQQSPWTMLIIALLCTFQCLGNCNSQGEPWRNHHTPGGSA